MFKIRAFQGVEIVKEMGPYSDREEAVGKAQELADEMDGTAQVFVEDAEEVEAATVHQLSPPEWREKIPEEELDAAYHRSALELYPAEMAEMEEGDFWDEMLGVTQRDATREHAKRKLGIWESEEEEEERDEREHQEFEQAYSGLPKWNPGPESRAIPTTKAAFIREYHELLDAWAGSRRYLGAGKYTELTEPAVKAGARLADMVEAHSGWAQTASDQWEADQQRKAVLLNPQWLQEADEEIEEAGTEGAFTKQARRAGYTDTLAFARAVMAGWRSGEKKVYNKKTRKKQGITKKTMYRANFAINAQKRRRNPIGSGKNLYIAWWNRDRVEVMADSSYAAQVAATEYFQSRTRKKVKGYQVTVGLAEIEGKQVAHRTHELFNPERNPTWGQEKTPARSDITEIYKWGQGGPETLWVHPQGRGSTIPLTLLEEKEAAEVLERNGINFDEIDWTTMGEGKVNFPSLSHHRAFSVTVRLFPGTYKSGPLRRNPSTEEARSDLLPKTKETLDYIVRYAEASRDLFPDSPASAVRNAIREHRLDERAAHDADMDRIRPIAIRIVTQRWKRRRRNPSFTGKGWAENKEWLKAARASPPQYVSALRAREIVSEAQASASPGPWSDQLDRVMSKGEYRFVYDHWMTMRGGDGSASFVDALLDLANPSDDAQRGRAFNPSGDTEAEINLDRQQRELLDTIILHARNEGQFYPSEPAKAVDYAIKWTKGDSREELAFDLKVIRPLAVRAVQTIWRRKNAQQISLPLSRSQEMLLGELVLAAENDGRYYPSQPAKAVDHAIRDLIEFKREAVAEDFAEIRTRAVRQVQTNWRRKNAPEGR